MKIAFSTTPITNASSATTRAHFVEEARGVKRIVRESGVDTLEIGIGKRADIDQRAFVTLVRALIRTAKKEKVTALAIDASMFAFPKLADVAPACVGARVAENMLMADYEFTTYKTKTSDKHALKTVTIHGTDKAFQKGVTEGIAIGEAVNACRTLANTPGGDMTPQTLAKAAKQAVSGLPVTVETLTAADMKKLGMGAILAVGKGSDTPPTFTIMQYQGGGKARPIVLAGKGITFDSGGINLKGGDGHEMHMDMSGAAAVIQTVALAARMKVKQNVIGLIPAAENMPSGSALRPHDIITSLSGKTIEVINTDAEGRLVLADALTYAKRFKPSVVLDAATLTGGALSALGLYASALLTRDEALADTLLSLSETSGDYLWRLPMWDVYEDSVKSTFADIANCVSGGAGRYASSTNGGMFLWQFAKELDCPWAHLDIAPRMTAAPGDELSKGAAGEPVRLLYAFIQAWTPKA